MEERRRSARRTIDGQSMAVYSVESVRVVDVSAVGVLLHTDELVDPGARGVLRLSVAGAPFAVDVEVRRVIAAPLPAAGFRVAARFMDITPKHRHLIERFISR